MSRIIILFLILTVPAAARDLDGKYANSALKPWFDSLRSGKGPCCADADGNVIKDSDWESINDPKKPNVHYRVFINDKWIDVPDEAVLTQPNLYGRVMVWPMYKSAYGGPLEVEVRCFLPAGGI